MSEPQTLGPGSTPAPASPAPGDVTNPAGSGGKTAAFDWHSQATDLMRGSPDTFKAFSNDAVGLQAMMKGYAESQKLIGQKGLVKLPDNATDDQKKAFNADLRKLMGVPDTADGYKFQDEVDGQKADKQLRQSFAKVAHEAGLSPSQVEALDKWTYQYQKVAQEATNKAFGEAATKRFGDKAQTVMEVAKTLIADNIDPSFKDLVPSLDNNSLLIMADVMLTMNKKLGGEDVPGGGDALSTGGKTPEEIRREKLTLMQSEAYRNPMDPQHQAVNKRVIELNQLWFNAMNVGQKKK